MIEVLVLAASLAGAQAFDAETVPKAREQIVTACAASPKIIVRWESFGEDEPAAQALIAGRLEFLGAAFDTVCKDERTKQEFSKQVVEIILSQAYGAADPVIYLVNGRLHVEYLWVKGEPPPDVKYVASEIVSRLRGEQAEAP